MRCSPGRRGSCCTEHCRSAGLHSDGCCTGSTCAQVPGGNRRSCKGNYDCTERCARKLHSSIFCYARDLKAQGYDGRSAENTFRRAGGSRGALQAAHGKSAGCMQQGRLRPESLVTQSTWRSRLTSVRKRRRRTRVAPAAVAMQQGRQHQDGFGACAGHTENPK